MPDTKYSTWTLKKLEEKSEKLTAQRDELSAEHKAVQAALDAKRAQAAALEKLSAMSEAERAAMIQALSVKGISSDEAFGLPGA